HVADRQAVRALAAIRGVARRAVIAVEDPASRHLPVPPVPGHQKGARVITPAENRARPAAVQESDPREETIDAIAIVVAPNSIHAGGGGIVVVKVLVALWIVRSGSHLFT